MCAQLGKKVGMSGGGALAALSMATCVSHRLRRTARDVDRIQTSALFAIVWSSAGQVPRLIEPVGASLFRVSLSFSDLL